MRRPQHIGQHLPKRLSLHDVRLALAQHRRLPEGWQLVAGARDAVRHAIRSGAVRVEVGVSMGWQGGHPVNVRIMPSYCDELIACMASGVADMGRMIHDYTVEVARARGWDEAGALRRVMLVGPGELPIERAPHRFALWLQRRARVEQW